jgi:formylmethanofuran dehydrogenase subunit A
VADVAVYAEQADRQAMFERADYVFKDGVMVVRDGEIVQVVGGATHVARAPYDPALEARLRQRFRDYHTVRLDNFKVADGEIEEAGGWLVAHASERSQP